VPDGRHALSFEFAPTGKAEPMKGKGTPGNVTLLLDGRAIGKGKLPVTIPIAMGLAGGVSVGADAGAPVTADYDPPFAFTGTIERVVYDVSGAHVADYEAEIRMALARQ
jgi:arylsulfatase